MIDDSASRMPCRFCGAPLSADDVNVKLAVARCGACKAVWSFSDDAGARLEAATRPEVPLPEGFTLDRSGGRLQIRRRWFTPLAFFLAFFCLFWDGFLVVWYAIGISEGAVIMLVFPLLHVAVGVVMTYTTIALFVNRTIFEVSSGQLSVRHVPLPFKGVRDLPTASIQQLWCKETWHKTKSGRSCSYEVHVKKRDGAAVTLVKGLETPEQALFLEQQIERHLGVRDAPVAGELPR